SGASQLATGGAPILDGRRQPSCGGTSWMTRECQVRICEGLGVQFPGPTRQKPNPSETVACQLSPAPPDIPAHARSAALCQEPTHAMQQKIALVGAFYSITSSAVA